VHNVPEVQTDDTVRAFSGTLRRISGGVDDDVVPIDPFTASASRMAVAALVGIRNLPVEKFRFGDTHRVLIEKPRTPQ
jgi:hypothetical protein